MAGTGLQIQNLIANRDADACLSPLMKHAVRQILDWKIRSRIVGRGNPASQSHPSTSRSWIGSVKEQEPKLVMNLSRTTRSSSVPQQNERHPMLSGVTRHASGSCSSSIRIAWLTSPPK